MNEFNQFVAAHNTWVDQINQDALASRTVADRYHADALSHNRRCAGPLVRPEDLAIVTRERAARAAASRPAH